MNKKIWLLLFMVLIFTFLSMNASVKGLQLDLDETELITGIQDIYIEVGTISSLKDINFKHEGIKVESGYDYGTVDHGIDVNLVNTEGYDVSYYVSYKNIILQSIPIKVYFFEEFTDPELTLKDDTSQELTFYALEELTEEKLLEYVEAYGLHGQDLSSEITVEGLENIQSQKVGTYEITYRVKERIRTHNSFRTLESDLTITVHLVDDVKPIVRQKKPITIEVFDPNVPRESIEINYDEFFWIEDAYDGKYGYPLTIEYDDSNIDFYTIGKESQHLIVTVTDSNNNVTQESFEVQIIDKTAPRIEVLERVAIHHIDSKTHPNYLEMIRVTDNYDETVYVEVIDEHVNYNRKGAYQVTVIAYDQSMNSSYEVLIVRVVDDESLFFDVITEADGKIHITKYVGKDPSSVYDFMDYFVYGDESYYYDVYTGQVDYQTPGTYKVDFYAIDTFGKRTTITVEVEVEDDQVAPVISGLPDEFVIPVHTVNYYFLEGLTVTDNVWENPMIKVNTDDINFNRLGTYTIIFEVEDYSGNYDKYERPVRIIDNEKPYIVNQPESETLTVEVESYDFLKNIQVKDNYYSPEDLAITVIDNVEYGKIGQYEVVYRISDPSDNINEITIPVYVVDNVKPVLEITGIIYVEVGSTPSYWEYIQVSDNHDTINELTVEFIDDGVNYHVLGDYEAKIRVIDQSGNPIEEKAIIRVIDSQSPMIKGVKDRMIRVGRKFNPLKGITAQDNYDGDLTGKIVVSGDYNTRQKGKYLITLTVIDSSGNETIEMYLLTVKSNFIPIFIILFSVSMGLTVFGMIIYRLNKMEIKLSKDIETDDWTLNIDIPNITNNDNQFNADEVDYWRFNDIVEPDEHVNDIDRSEHANWSLNNLNADEDAHEIEDEVNVYDGLTMTDEATDVSHGDEQADEDESDEEYGDMDAYYFTEDDLNNE